MPAMSGPLQDTAAQFSRQARAYAESPSHARGEDLAIVAELAAARPGERALDLATGPGHTALRIAERAGFVVGADAAAGMIAQAGRLAAERGLDNVRFLLADAHALPFAEASFDLATCRIAPHHFADVPRALREVHRVLRPGGRFVLEDSLGPDDTERAVFLERLEKRRDPTHVHSLSRAEWHAAFDAAGFTIVHEQVHEKQHDFDLWIARTGLDAAAIAAIGGEVLAAPPAVREALFDIADGRVAVLHDQKLILRAEKGDQA